MSLYSLGFYLLLLSTGLAALKWGGEPEKAAATMFLVAAIATALIFELVPGRYQFVVPARVLVDLALLVGLGLITFRIDLWWPRWAFAFQAISTLAHLSRLMDHGLSRLGYQLMAGASGYPVVLALAVGVYQHHRRTLANASSRTSSAAHPTRRSD